MSAEMFQTGAGIIAGALVCASCFLYVYSIVIGHTKPSRITWWILAAGSLLLALSYWSSGARSTIWIPFAYVLVYAIVAMLSVRFGSGGYIPSKTDVVSLCGGLISLALWWFTKDPLVALTLQMAVETFALVPTFAKTYADPSSESKSAWLLATAASAINLFAVSSWSYAVAGYPIFLLATNATIVFAIFHKHQ